MNLSELFNRLDQFESRVPLDEIQDLLNHLDTCSEELYPTNGFADEQYQRNLLRRTDHYEVLLLCFEPGQRTPIHDHAGVCCGVRVLQGEATETVFAITEDSWIFATGSRGLPMGSVVGSMDSDIHQLSNLQPNGKRLITLHIYSPPLGEVGNYRLEDNSIEWVTAASRQANAV